MKILLFGHDGQIGWELSRLLLGLGSVRGVSYPELDYAKADDIRRLVQTERPDVIVNAAAYTAVDKAEEEPELAGLVNGVAPGVLAEEAKASGAILVHYSTDFVFDGGKGQPYTELDTPNPLNVYGRTKLDGDRAIEAVDGRHLIFRVSWIYGLRGKNFLLTMRRLAGQRPELAVVDDQVGCPTWCRSVAEGTVAALKAVLSGGLDSWGLYNMVCSGSTSWHGFARAFLPEAVRVKAVSSAEFGSRVERPAYSVLDCVKVRDVFGVVLPDWREALSGCLRDEMP